jgi:hypothetical protein
VNFHLFLKKIFNSSLLWDVFIINSVEQLQTLPKTQSEIDISPFLRTQKPSSSLFFLKVNNSGAAKVEYLTKKKINNIKIQSPAISMHVRLPQSLISMSIHKLYTNRSSFAQSARFSRPGASLNYRQRFARKDNAVLTPGYWFPILFFLFVVLKYKLRVTVYCYCKKFGKIRKC